MLLRVVLFIKDHFLLVAHRLREQKWLAVTTLFGLVLLFALVMAIPAYADAVSYRLLSIKLLEAIPGYVPGTARTPFRFQFEYSSPYRGATQWQQATRVDSYLTNQVSQDLGLPKQELTRSIRSFAFELYSPENLTSSITSKKVFSWTSFFTINDLGKHIYIVEGREPGPVRPGSPLEVLISQNKADIMGVSVGEEFVAVSRESKKLAKIPVRVVGVWTPRSQRNLYLPAHPRELADMLVISEEAYLNQLAPQTIDEVGKVTWTVWLDSSTFLAQDVPGLLNRVKRVKMNLDRLLRGAILRESPEKLLLEYHKTTGSLTFLLAAYSLPYAALFLAFIYLVSSLIVERQRNEIAVLRSRGAASIQIMGIAFFETCVLLGATLLICLPVSQGMILLMGRTRSFLDFSLPEGLRPGLNSLSFWFGAAACLLVLAARLVPVYNACRANIVGYKREAARANRPPWWQQAGLDLLLFIPAGYGVYLLNQQGSLVLPGKSTEAAPSDIYQNPLLLLVPALIIFASSLLLLRIMPKLMSAAAWAARRTPSVSFLIASRHLARSPRYYTAPMMMLVLTLSLSIFNASLAQTLDRHFHDQQYYYVGADNTVIDEGQCLKYDPFGHCDPSAGEESAPTWAFLPVSSYTQAPGVQAAARIGRWYGRARLGGASQKAIIIGIDRLDFPAVAYWRADFSPASLGTLMNALAETPEGVLVSKKYMSQTTLKVGDAVLVDVALQGRTASDGKTLPLALVIVGSFDYFPTWYPDEGPLFVANLETIFEKAAGQQPYNVWLKTKSEVICRELSDKLGRQDSLGLNIISCLSARERIFREQIRPEHQGLYGLLSVAFIGAAVLTALGFLLYLLFSFRQRSVEVGMLRALGLSLGKMRMLLFWELLCLMGMGVLVGTGLGVGISRLFIQYLQVGAEKTAQVPPFTVQIGWGPVMQVYLLFGVILLAALIGLSVILNRTNMSQAIKMGETV